MQFINSTVDCSQETTILLHEHFHRHHLHKKAEKQVEETDAAAILSARQQQAIQAPQQTQAAKL